MEKLTEFYGIGDVKDMTMDRLALIMEDMYQKLALSINQSTSSSSGSMKAWGCFVGNGVMGPATFTNSYNIASIIHNATGGYVVTFTTPLTSGVDYAILVSCSSGTFKTFSGYQNMTNLKFDIGTWKMEVFHPVDAPHVSFLIIQ